jgi:cytochrome c-type biogenesis protein CcmH
MMMSYPLRLPSIVALLLVLGSAPVGAVIETYDFSDPDFERRYNRLSQELRCPKCQNQNIADSNAPISQDLRRLLHQQLEAGASDAEILSDMVGRYGEFVLYRPRTSGVTLWLWLAPALMLAIGAVFVLLLVRRGRGAAPAAVSDEEKQRLREMLDREDSR